MEWLWKKMNFWSLLFKQQEKFLEMDSFRANKTRYQIQLLNIHIYIK